MGMMTASTMVVTFMPSPIPNHRIKSGISASVGMARLIWIGPSISASPMRDRPAMTARAVPMTRPMLRPSSARVADVTEVVLQAALGDQPSEGLDDRPGRRENARINPPQCRSGNPGQHQQCRTDLQSEGYLASGAEPAAGAGGRGFCRGGDTSASARRYP